ncbi:MAG TPA: formyltetrahydrofolate deformylase [Terriglobales bacterium]|jgi:formyltetrahydrofolate deformylase|nr:formyltetrahydrofolate deformylase [Terriglobales bacterium]
MPDTATLLVSCLDRKGLVASISSFIFHHGGNILLSDQYTDLEAGIFLARFEWRCEGFQIPRDQIVQRFQPLAQEFGMRFEVHFSDHIPKVALFASRLPHCLEDLLQRQQAGEFKAEIAVVISNHADAGVIANRYGASFLHFPITAETKKQQEAAELRELQSRGVELIVLARYMQVLTSDFIAAYPNRVINIHHSFLPAFVGAKPYHQAFERGVKLIGATGHYVTMSLDEGPIIEQEVVRVSHRDSIEDLVRKGRDLERTVLGRAVRLHLGHRVLTYGNKTVVFD